MTTAQMVAGKSNTRSSAVLVTAWVVTLTLSLLPKTLWQEFVGAAPAWLPSAKITIVVACLAASGVWTSLRLLRPYLTVILALESAGWLIGRIGATALWQSVFPPASQFVVSMLETQLLRLIVTLGVILALVALRYRRQDFFLTVGQMDATAAPIPFIMRKPTGWKTLGTSLAVWLTLGTLTFLVLAGTPSLSMLAYALPLQPAILVYAALNAFNEEMTYRASLLATLETVIGRRHALLLTAAYFGLGHYYGVPYGLIGVVMAGILGWLLGKSMLETRGFAWAWLIHFLQDVVIFLFMALGAIMPGGR